MDIEQTSGLTHSPLHGTTGFKRSKLVLDALVAISVCTGNQCLALSVSFGSNRVRITIAQNDATPSPAIATHLTSIWKQLGELATLQRQLRQENRLVDVVLGKPPISPKAAESHLPVGHHGTRALKKLKENLQRDIHKHCYLKTKQRLKKYLEQYATFYQFYRWNRQALDPTEVIADVAFNLLELHRLVMLYKGPLHTSGVPEKLDWDNLAKCSSLLLHNYTENASNVQIKIGDVVDAWRRTAMVRGMFLFLSRFLTPHPHLQSPLCLARTRWSSLLIMCTGNKMLLSLDVNRGLEKMVSLSRHIQELVNFAYSPRLRSMLDKPLDIVRLKPIAVQLPEPSSSDAIRTVTRAFNSTRFAESRYNDDFELLEDMLRDQLILIPATLTKPVSSHTVHAEYALLLHHHAEVHNIENPPPFQYIAVNKLACFCCWSAYKGYTQMTGRIFFLRGSHSKLYFPWAPTTHVFLDDMAQSMRAYLYTQLVDLYSTHLAHLEDVRNRMSDSSVASLGADSDVLVDSEDVQASKSRRMAEDEKMEAEMASNSSGMETV